MAQNDIFPPTILGALLYNIQTMITYQGITNEQVSTYSDYVLDGNNDNLSWIIPYQGASSKIKFTYTPDPNDVFGNLLIESYKSGNTYFWNTVTYDEYKQNLADNGILGMSFLPWNTYVTMNPDDQQYYNMHVYGKSVLKMYNPLDMPSLMLKGQSILIFIIAFVLLRTGYKMIRRRV